MRLSNGEGRLEDLPAGAAGCARAGGLPLRGGVACAACGIKRRVKPMNDEMILSPEMDEELSNGKGADENE